MSEIRLRRLPGASYRGSNAFIVAQRKIFNLEEPFPITFDKWGPGNQLHDWYNRIEKENRYIQTMQLRKERESPFFHEFIVIRLRSGTYWRIDRRQLPDEGTPLDCIAPEGVPAHDTVEQVRSLESNLYARSDCLIELEFNADVHLGLILRICRAIRQHHGAKVYTVQRYNCYFFAQTMLFCTACGVSDWAGVGEAKEGQTTRKSPWRTPNAAAPDFSTRQDLENATRLEGFKWNPTDTFGHDWGKLSTLSNNLVHASPLLRHADHCNYCIDSQMEHRQRSLSSEINRLKQELVVYWNEMFCEVLDKALMANHKRLVGSGVWDVVYMSETSAAEDCKKVVSENLADVRSRWEDHSDKRVEKLINTVRDLLDPAEVCDAWYPDPDEWKSTWTCKDGGPVKEAMSNWETNTRTHLKTEISELEAALEKQTIEVGKKAQEAAMRARLDSFTRSMRIKIRVAQNEGDLIVPEGAAPAADQQSIFSGKTKLSMRTMKTALTTRATEFKSKMRRFFGKSHKMEDADITQMRKQIEQLIEFHAARVEQYKMLLHCGAAAVQNDMRSGVNDVWSSIIF